MKKSGSFKHEWMMMAGQGTSEGEASSEVFSVECVEGRIKFAVQDADKRAAAIEFSPYEAHNFLTRVLLLLDPKNGGGVQ
jgi:hypothetical protein